jgi:ubiquinone/menaquinone biosynthesis C-methylase UbiE
MAEFSQAEKQLLIAVKNVSRRKKDPDRRSLSEFGERFFDEDLVDWTEAYESLARAGYLQRNGNAYSLTAPGEEVAKEVRREDSIKGFNERLVRSEKSKAYSGFCERVYGMNLCQCNMMDVEQLNKLLEVLGLNESSRVLDLGCGIGSVTEYISDLTGARITGVDFAEDAIIRARSRTRAKRSRLTYEVGDMNDLQFPDRSFDTIIAIDTLYFVDDLEKTTERMNAILAADGQMAAFYSQLIGTEEPKELLLAGGTRFAQALDNLQLRFQTWCFSENESEIWKKEKRVAEELRAEFEREGYLDLYKSRIKDSKHLLEFVESGRVSRYLYHVKRADADSDNQSEGKIA